MGKAYFLQNISISQHTNLGAFTVEQTSKQLNDVVVTGRKRLIEGKVDRLVFNVENSIASQGCPHNFNTWVWKIRF